MTFDPIPYASAAVGPAAGQERRAGLIVYGILSILIGVCSGCAAAFAPAMYFFAPAGAAAPLGSAADVVFAALLFVGAAALFVWVGVDSIRRRRWVRPVVVAIGWLTIASSTVAVALMILELGTGTPAAGVAPVPAAATAATAPVATTLPTTVPVAPAPPPRPGTMELVIGLVAIVLMGLALPGAFVAFYASPGVRRTLEASDAGPGWTERCSLRVFVACAGLAISGVTTLGNVTKLTTPFFGTYVEGAAAAAVVLGSAALSVAAAVLMFRGRRAGWWLAVATIVLGTTSSVLSLARLGQVEFSRRSGMTLDEAEVSASTALGGHAPLVFSVLTGLACLGYLIWIRPDVWRPRREESGSSPGGSEPGVG